MKKLLSILFFLAAATEGFAQQAPATFYGVDFSLAKICGADETDAEFLLAFTKINDLFLSESKKYDVSRFLRLPAVRKEITVAKRSTKAAIRTEEYVDAHNLCCDDPAYDCAERIEALVAGYDLPQTEGKGVVIVANMLDKTHAFGNFYFVAFDIATRRVESCVLTDGKPGGFGLRNYWANAVLQSMKAYYRLK